MTSPGTRSGERLVHSTAVDGHAWRIVRTREATASSTCSTSSSTTSTRFEPSSVVIAATVSTPTCCAPSSVATASGTLSESATEANAIQLVPSGNWSDSWETASCAKRVLPTPPGPTSVSIRLRVSASAVAARSASRPITRAITVRGRSRAA